ncbi:MAG: hypothetical protein ABEK59_01020 [Halobacteria archaeon]
MMRKWGPGKGQTEILGVVMILGITLASITAILIYFEPTHTDTRAMLDKNSIQNEFALLDSDISSIAVGSSQKRYSSSNLRKGTLDVDPDEGWVKIEHDPSGQPKYTISNISMGRLRYENDNETIAYQGGGVWKNTGNGSMMVSPPEFRYRKDTLTFPLINITSNENFAGGKGQFVIEEVQDPKLEFPNITDGFENLLTNGTVNITVDSEFYVGWENYFRRRSTTKINGINHGEQKVNVSINVPSEVTFQDGAATVQNNGIACQGGCTINGSSNEGQTYPSPNNTVELKIDTWSGKCSSNSTCKNLSDAASDSIIGDDSSATVFFQDADFSMDSNVDIETAGENISIITNGDFDLGNNELMITSNEGGVKYYINESFKANGNGQIGSDPWSNKQPSRNILLIAGEFLPNAAGAGTLEFDAMIYAPNSDVDTSGTPNVWGALISNTMDFSGDLELSEVGGATIELELEDSIKFLHVTDNQVKIE